MHAVDADDFTITVLNNLLSLMPIDTQASKINASIDIMTRLGANGASHPCHHAEVGQLMRVQC